jgi:tetratricopeptide (TPR) repeat protein
MVSRVYTPLVTPYSRSQGPNKGAVSSATDEQKQQLPSQQQAGLNGGDHDLRRPSNGLQSVQYDRSQKIPLNAVIHDFKNTMTALGTDDQTRSEVSAYLNVVRLQAAKEQPEVSFIKHTLRTAGNSLDQFISKALGQPSHVVKEWVDALLLQDIDYHANLPPEETAFTPSATDKPTASVPQTPENTQTTDEPSISTSVKARLKSLIEQAKANHQASNTTEADQDLQQALELLQGQNRPEWEGKIWQLRGRFADQAGQWSQAISFFEEAAKQFETANLPYKQANALHAIGSILDDQGQLENAKPYYKQVVALDAQHGDAKAQLRSLNDLGSLHLRLGETAPAIETLQRASQIAQSNDFPALVQSDILSNLGAAYRQNRQYEPAIQSYQQSLQTAKAAKDKSRYTTTLQQLAALFVEAGQPDSAMKALQRLKSLSQA